jgi:hypothetical protein
MCATSTAHLIISFSFIVFHLLRISPCGLFQFRKTSEIMNHRHMVGLLGRVISSLPGLYLHRTAQHKKDEDKQAGFEPAIQYKSAQGPRLFFLI